VLDDAALAAHAAAARAGGTRLIVDEIYHGIVYGTPAQTILAHAPDAIVVSGFSKYYGMTGWRLGWMVVPEGLIGAVERLAQNFFISAPTLAQLAGVAAFDATAELDARVAEYARNRALLIEGLPKAGFRDVHAPAGAFYLYSGLPEGVTESRAFCHDLLHRTGVALAPGIDFDPLRGHGTVRFSFAGAHDRIAEALRRLGAG
jgi:aspartate/methionine/tyrosine aminotransferase